MKHSLSVLINDKDYSSEESRTLCKYNDITLSVYSDGLLDSLVAQWNMVMPITQRATLMFDDEPSVGFKRKVSFSNKVHDPIPDPRNSKGKY